MSKDKRALRARVLAARDALTFDDVEAKTAAIAERLYELPEYQSAKVVMFYVAWRSEVQTADMIRRTLRGGRVVVAPIVRNNQIWPAVVRDLDALVRGAYGILEPPESADRVAPSIIDTVLVPGAVFDLRGYRLGYGGGYYDRFLRHVRSRAAMVGLAFELQVADEVPVGPHDLPVDMIITENRVIDCRPRHE